MTVKIDTSNWKEFKLKDLFTIEKGKESATESDYEVGDIPLITVRKDNNGVGFNIKNPKKVFKNSFTIVGLGDGNMAGSFYHHYDFCASNGNIVLIPKKDISFQQGLFIRSVLMTLQYSDFYSFGYSLTKKKVEEKITIMLPVVESGEPDWEYMNEFMKSLETEMIEIENINDVIKIYNLYKNQKN